MQGNSDAGALPRCVYVAGMGAGAGKTTIALGLAELLSRQVVRIGVFRPLVHNGDDPPCLSVGHDWGDKQQIL